jgi:hypothetical protein
MKAICLRALVLVVLLLHGCDRYDATRVESKDVPSPNGELTLRIEDNESGGAAVAGQTSAYLFPSGSSADGGKLIFRGSAMDGFSASWRGPDRVDLSYTGGYVTTCNGGPIVLRDISVSVSGCK